MVTIAKKIILAALALMLGGCSSHLGSVNYDTMDQTEVYDAGEYSDLNKVNISIEHATGEFVSYNLINNIIKIENNTKSKVNIYVQSELLNFEGEVFATNTESFDILKIESKIVQGQISLKDEIETGRYYTKITVWDGDPKMKETKLLKQSISDQEIIVFQNIDDFEFLDEIRWGISNKLLGKTNLKAENTYTEDGTLKIALTKNKLEGGELYSVNKYGYGIYEIRMKLPSAQSSITGFFMYMPPDFFYEIDMELYNDSSGTLLLTTYAEGNVSNTEKYSLGFDVTKDFHDYRFEYYEDNIKFYVDNQFIDQFKSGIPKEEMQLMVNCWYPEWLGLIPVTEKKELLIDWIKY